MEQLWFLAGLACGMVFATMVALGVRTTILIALLAVMSGFLIAYEPRKDTHQQIVESL